MATLLTAEDKHYESIKFYDEVKFMMMNKKQKKYEEVIAKLSCRVLSFYQMSTINDPQLECMLVMNNHQIHIREYNDELIHPYQYGLIISKKGNELIEFLHNDYSIIQHWKQKLTLCSDQSSFFAKYRTLEKISRTQNSKIVKVQSLEDLKIYVAKILDLTRDNRDMSSVVNEVKIMKSLNHPNLVQLHEVYKTTNSIVIIMEYLRGGDLLTKLAACEHYDEHKAAILMKNLLEAVKYLEDKTLVHKDIKPSNILLVNPDNDTTIKLADFDLSSYQTGSMLNKLCGTPGYMAPEVFKKENVSIKSDIYSCGLVLFYLLTGQPAFIGNNHESIFDENYKGAANFDHNPRWKKLSEETKKFIKCLIAKDPKDRLSPEEALQSNWIRKHCPKTKYFVFTKGLANVFKAKGFEVNNPSAVIINSQENDPNDTSISKANLCKLLKTERATSPNIRKAKNTCLLGSSMYTDEMTTSPSKDLLFSPLETPHKHNPKNHYCNDNDDDEEGDEEFTLIEDKPSNLNILEREFKKQTMLDLKLHHSPRTTDSDKKSPEMPMKSIFRSSIIKFNIGLGHKD